VISLAPIGSHNGEPRRETCPVTRLAVFPAKDVVYRDAYMDAAWAFKGVVSDRLIKMAQ